MTHHIRRLFMSPLPAFEGEMAACGGPVPPAVLAGSKCLAICIEVSLILNLFTPELTDRNRATMILCRLPFTLCSISCRMEVPRSHREEALLPSDRTLLSDAAKT